MAQLDSSQCIEELHSYGRLQTRSASSRKEIRGPLVCFPILELDSRRKVRCSPASKLTELKGLITEWLPKNLAKSRVCSLLCPIVGLFFIITTSFLVPRKQCHHHKSDLKDAFNCTNCCFSPILLTDQTPCKERVYLDRLPYMFAEVFPGNHAVHRYTGLMSMVEKGAAAIARGAERFVHCTYMHVRSCYQLYWHV